MMALLGFILECAAVAAFVGSGMSLLMTTAFATVRPLFVRLSSSLRADLAFLAVSLPAIAAVIVTASAAAPSVLSALGFAEDHCLHHTHHLHLCIIHSAGLRPALAAVGAFALAIGAFRAVTLARSIVEINRNLRDLQRLGALKPAALPIIEVPSALALCHAAGWFRPRILISTAVARALRPDDLACALTHERAHLERRDPLASLLMSIAALFHPPFLAVRILRAHRTAAEEACDDVAASSVGDGARVAEALLAVAALQTGASRSGAIAFGEHALERRVRRLLQRAPRAPGKAHGIVAGALIASSAAAFALLYSDFVHHAVETLLQRLV